MLIGGLGCRLDLFFAEHAGLVLKRGTGFAGLFAARNDGDIQAADADTGAGALATRVEALTVPLLALGLRAAAAFGDNRLRDTLNGRPCDLSLHHQHVQGIFALFIPLAVLAARTDALLPAHLTIFKALAVQLQAP